MRAQCPVARLGVGSIIVAMVLGGALQLRAQQTSPARILVTTTRVKPDMVNTWREIIRTELIPAHKKIGVPWRWVFASGPLSGDAYTFVAVQPETTFAALDQPGPMTRAAGAEGAAKFNARITPTIVSQHYAWQTLIANASIQSFPASPPRLVRVSTIELQIGKGPEFAALTAKEFLPALRKAGVTDYLVFTTNYGGPTSQRTIVEYLSKYADLDRGGPIQRALGPEAAQGLNQRRAALTTRNEAAVYRFVPELSFGVPTPPSH